MPTYEYICEDCGHQFECFQSITAKTLQKCPECGKRGLKRLIGIGSGVIFKGNGFYQTDYRSQDYKKARENEKNAKTTASKEKTEAKAKPSDTADKTSQQVKNETKSK